MSNPMKDQMPPQTDSVLSVTGLFKRHGDAETLHDVNFFLAPGERVALLGHNGAGKTTLMKIVLGLWSPSEGEVRVANAVPGSAEARKASAYLPEAVTFHRSLTGREQLKLFARLAGESPKVTGPLLERVGLADAADRRIGTWSKGMRQRLGLAQVLLGKPSIALLDEPTSGLDPISRHDLYAIIDEMASNGTAVLIASHALTEVEARTDRIAIMRKGQLVANDTLAHLSSRAELPIRLMLTARDNDAAEIHARLGGKRINGASVELLCQPENKMERLAHIAALGDLVIDVEMDPPSLEDLYRHYSGEDRT
ncbi:ABC transporter ATP-binding protein [Hoeflea prorocentri]|uniref:ABC transporter ATP-binding protein n=1 Tax=Hoeflea prorocentri TaxID=1922333 RepID=A0A9X3UG59_9HYPH|nr:ABC transporter ATP-binding protein [Hoeflea prorocentri]MCY6380183.1 ABC transporter ATP-binding protein [Hoeflea prorocentri]MDA5397983.1 ABC transporter ATP-binding protein [Hoeflea prorocentri]